MKNRHINIAYLIAFLLIISACSTKNKSWVNRQFHNTTAKYNGYFNGKESVKLGVKKLEESFVDDYSSVLPMYKTGDLKKSKKTHSYMDKAIKKGSVVIQRHSIKIKGKEYCKWIDDNYLMVGKSYFYKGEFDEAIKTFSFIKNEYKKNEIRYDASLWLIRSMAEKNDFMSAEVELDELTNDRKFPKNLDVELAKISADFYLKQKNYPLALGELKKLDKLIKKKSKKVRYNYIMAQIYQQQNKFKSAKSKYELVLKSSPEYEMVFNAKMNLARSLESGSRDTKKIRHQLLKMTKDDKNKEYLDQIYFTLAEMDINNVDTLSAIDNYLLSTVNSVDNNTQKALSFLALAKIEFNRSLYPSSKVYYDSTLFYMEEDFRLYNEAKDRHKILEDLVYHLEVIAMQDSLQMLALLPKEKLNKVINTIIQEEIKKEREALEEERLKQQMMYENNRNGGKGEQFGNNTSGGKWYFYNPATLSFGLSEFRKKWGKRKLEDDWRRKDKKTNNSFELDSTQVEDDKKGVVEDKKNPNYYLSQLPKTEQDFESSNEMIKESTYQAGVIYRSDLGEYERSTGLFMNLLSRFPFDEGYAPLAYYNAYTNYLELEKESEAEALKKLLIKNFPNSIYAKLLDSPEFKEELLAQGDKEELEYQEVYGLYTSGEYGQVINRTIDIESKNHLKLLFVKGLAYVSLGDTNSCVKTLEELVAIEYDDKIKLEASYLLEAIRNPEKMKKANEQALTESPYLIRSGKPHMSPIILPKEGVDINYLKTLISDYHMADFGNEVFEISAMMMGVDKHLLMVKTFANSAEAMSYNQLLVRDNNVVSQIEKTDYKLFAISFENFKEFYKNKDIEGYYNFFKKNYLEVK